MIYLKSIMKPGGHYNFGLYSTWSKRKSGEFHHGPFELKTLGFEFAPSECQPDRSVLRVLDQIRKKVTANTYSSVRHTDPRRSSTASKSIPITVKSEEAPQPKTSTSASTCSHSSARSISASRPSG